MNRIARFFNRENPTVRKARNITRRKIQPLNTNYTPYRTRKMSPPARMRLTGRPYIPKGAVKNRIILSTAVASNQARRLETVRKQAVKNTPKKKRSLTRRAVSG